MKALILAAENFQDLELLYPKYRLIEEGIEVNVAGVGEKNYKGKYGYPIAVDGNIEDHNPDDFDVVIIPGGFAPDKLRMSQSVLNFIKEMDKQKKTIASICHGAWVLVSANILKGRKVTCYEAIKDDVSNAGAEYEDREVVVDNNLITSRMPDDLPAFCREIITKLK